MSPEKRSNNGSCNSNNNKSIFGSRLGIYQSVGVGPLVKFGSFVVILSALLLFKSAKGFPQDGGKKTGPD